MDAGAGIGRRACVPTEGLGQKNPNPFHENVVLSMVSVPPRIAVTLPMEVSEFYFVTLCVKGRKPVLADPRFAEVLFRLFSRLDHWVHEAWVIMPDHLHVLLGPKSRIFHLSDWSHYVKRVTQKEFSGDWKWQKGIFDHLLRSWETGVSTWSYLQNNPVRAGLVRNWWEWPFFGGNLASMQKEILKKRTQGLILDAEACIWTQMPASLQNVERSVGPQALGPKLDAEACVPTEGRL